jgi:hypothetical protein
MGRRRQRKLIRKSERRDRRNRYARQITEPYQDDDDFHTSDDIDHIFAGLYRGQVQITATATCGRCSEFVEDGDFGRGTCLHPASGVLAPWHDTPACPFFSGNRRSY